VSRKVRGGAAAARPARRVAAARDETATSIEELLSDVVRMPDHGRVTHARRKRPPIAHQHLADERAALADSLTGAISADLAMETGEEPVFLRQGMARHTLRKLRAGHWVVQDEVDLHGLNVHEAHTLLGIFLNDCIKRGTRCVRVIHGKGLRSKNREPVLKRKVAVWLMKRNEVLAFCQARQADGGSGAMMVLLKGG
jgi:DNA-nicking Smr family endonuclease